ncbi:isoaspartyl peptidase/L-asparaginase [Altererythrobacter aurantiacus]|uniref:Isoaspartyl peptidase n=1 Tax=Parapontixanthobacter aurantiacus TaxID=1463599 RepID=A0A844ZF85_9SPHN|nr:isoaspartyl peptidase/L-asparaginase [Parapontixanthobacter aurantiacus]MXO86438.1 isoaspartyl peptidase/L-asparaginase [Parapontixanthobacter aurantiacus]
MVFATAGLAQPDSGEGRWSLAIHGGAGTILRENMTSDQEAEYEAALAAALDAGSSILADGGSALDAVEAVVTRLEDDPKFNAGRGAVFTWDEANELDAAIMDGRTREAGAVTGVTSIKNPILLARAVMMDGRHVFLSGEGAETFANERGIEAVDPSYFRTEKRLEALKRLKERELSALDVDHKYGTVGAVALDQQGNLAAATSTGGLTGKRWGRIGDAPIIGAGTYADNRACAVSATGAGEYFIRVGVAHEICSRLRMLEASNYLKFDKARPLAAEEEIRAMKQLVPDAVLAEVKELGGDGGVILVTPEGEALFSFNTPGMYRGRATSTGMREVAIFEGSDD